MRHRGWRRGARLNGRKGSWLGFTLAEILITIATLGTIAAVAVPAYREYHQRAQVSKAVSDIRVLEKEIKLYELDKGDLPDSLADIGRGSFPDPWGRPYEYLKIGGSKNKKIMGQVRKDRFIVPLNSDFDLYSMGTDGKSQPPLTAPDSWDDIVRANDGAYVGLASEY